jgi:apolipoprotein N-acyltransferase
MRSSIEIGAWLLRATRWGHRTTVDPYGRILGFMDHYAPDDQRMAALVPIRGARTVYSRTGDILGWGCVAGFFPLMVQLALKA